MDLTNIDKEEEKKRLEQEMEKRRDRVELWRAERRRKEMEVKKVTIAPVPQVKTWSLENESDDDDDCKVVPLSEEPPVTATIVVEEPTPAVQPDEKPGE